MSRKRQRESVEECTEFICQWRGCASAEFESQIELFEHVNQVHVTAKGPCLWGDCGYIGKTKQILQIHMRTHTGQKPYACDLCDAAFTQSSALKTHQLTHTGEKPYACDLCNAAFAQSVNLASHKRTHTGEKPYACNMCDAAFTQSNDLTIHKRTHTGEKPYTCDLCNAAFTVSGALKTHRRTHTGEKPYTCDLCDAAFSQFGTLANHKRTHTGEKPYACDVCFAAFARSGVLADHKIRKHVGPWCVMCAECYVPEETMVCGRCNMGQKFGLKEKQFFDFIYAYDERLAEVCFTLRDHSMGCGVRKRPDGLIQLQTKAVCVEIEAAMETTLIEDEYRIKLIIECDEHQHRAYEPSCELKRLQDIQERDNDALYVLRYNVDQPGGLETEQLTEFCKRLLAVLDGDFVYAIDSPTLIKIEYFGYTENREALLDAEMITQQKF